MINFSSSKQLTNTIMMVEPVDFDFNEETGKDNEFQKRPDHITEGINHAAMNEFYIMVERLRQEGINVLTLNKSLSGKKTPDAVFPNNWFSTEYDGTVILYPMLAENRRAEKRINDVEILLTNSGFHIENIINIGKINESNLILEGTGSMIIDRNNRIIYAAESHRCHPRQFNNFLKMRNYSEGIMFKTKSSNGRPIYHTNVMMSVGDKFAVVCGEAIYDKYERKRVFDSLSKDHEIIDISLKQVEKSFCGNILQVVNKDNVAHIVMSQNAFEAYTDKQFDILEKHGKVLNVKINTIEWVGGGSARCMMAEIFLPKVNEIEENLFTDSISI